MDKLKQDIQTKIDLIYKETLRIQEHGGNSQHYEELEYIKIKCDEINKLLGEQQ